MTLTVKDRADALATFRYAEVRLMEITAAWTPTTPEMEVKVMFGRHIWEFSQHADALGKRTFELRQPEHYTLRPAESHAELIEDAAKVSSTAERIAALYDVVLPALLDQYRKYIGETDSLLDAPSLVIIDRIVATHERQRADAEAVGTRMAIAADPVQSLRARAAAATAFVA